MLTTFNDLQDNDGDTALIMASRQGCVEAARLLLDHGANIDHQNTIVSARQPVYECNGLNAYLIDAWIFLPFRQE